MYLHPDKIHYWIAALYLPGIGPITFRKWMENFSDIEKLFLASETDLLEAGIKAQHIALIKQLNWDAITSEVNKLDSHVITYQDPLYPRPLLQLYNAPLLLFVKGRPEILSKPQIAIVGTRTPTSMAYNTALQFAKSLAKAGLIITSGMALGIDAASHYGALLEGQTVAVMGTGLNEIYPTSHRKLAEMIIEKGALVSEFLPNQAALPRNFPLRNRVISGLSLGVLVVEAALRSGSLITAKDALEQGRDVFAMPGSIHNPLARGCHYLLRQGAKLVETVKDILEELPDMANYAVKRDDILQSSSKMLNLDDMQKKIFLEIGYETTAIDTIIVRSGLTASEVSSILLALELEGCAQSVPGGYVRTI